MIRRKKIYKGFNKKRTNKMPSLIAGVLCVSFIGGYTVINVKNGKFLKFSSLPKPSKIIEKLVFWNNDSVDTMTDKDISKELGDIKSNKNKEDKQEVKRTQIEGWTIHTVQAGSSDNKNDVLNIENTLKQSKIPYSTVSVDGVDKVHTYTFFDEESARSHATNVKNVFPDAFVTTLKMPMLTFDYTDKFDYVKKISEEFANLITNFKDESTFWVKNKDKVDMKNYNEILTQRKNIVSKIKQEADKIDYKEMETFKVSLIKYLKAVDSNIEDASKYTNESKHNLSEGLFLSSIHEYYNFIGSISKA